MSCDDEEDVVVVDLIEGGRGGPCGKGTFLLIPIVGVEDITDDDCVVISLEEDVVFDDIVELVDDVVEEGVVAELLSIIYIIVVGDSFSRRRFVNVRKFCDCRKTFMDGDTDVLPLGFVRRNGLIKGSSEYNVLVKFFGFVRPKFFV